MNTVCLRLLVAAFALPLLACEAAPNSKIDANSDLGADTAMGDVSDGADDTAVLQDGEEGDDGDDGDAAADGADDADVPDSNVAPDTIVPPDPCSPNPCDEPPATHCSLHLDGLTSYTSVCSAVDGAAVCSTPATLTPCESGALCLAGACVEAAEPCDFPFGDRLGITTALVPGDQSTTVDAVTGQRADACCEDWDGDGFSDNGLGDTFRALAPLVGPAAELWAATLNRARPILDIHGLDDLVNDPEVWVFGYAGRDYEPANGTARITMAEFEAGTNLPLAAGRGHVEDGVLYVVDGYQRFPFGDREAPVYVETTSWHVTGRLVPAEDGEGVGLVGLTDGALGAMQSGLASHIELLATFNLHAALFCTCTEFADPDETAIDLSTGQCQPAENRAAACDEPDSFCNILTGPFCDFVVGQFAPDVDTNGDAQPDAMSVGWWMTLAPMALHEDRPLLDCEAR